LIVADQVSEISVVVVQSSDTSLIGFHVFDETISSVHVSDMSVEALQDSEMSCSFSHFLTTLEIKLETLENSDETLIIDKIFESKLLKEIICAPLFIIKLAVASTLLEEIKEIEPLRIKTAALSTLDSLDKFTAAFSKTTAEELSSDCAEIDAEIKDKPVPVSANPD
jgi:hypothetical protein